MGKALILVEPGKVDFEEYEELELRTREVRVRTLFSGISHGTEMSWYKGTNPHLSKAWDEDLQIYRFTRGQQGHSVRIPGYEEVGKVIEAGSEVEGVAVGDVIYGGWGHQTSAILSDNVAKHQKLPQKLDPILGVFLGIGVISLNGTLDASINIGENVVVFGLGTVGQIVVQLAKLSGAQVIAVDLLSSRLELAKKLGADLVINVQDTDVGEKIKKLTAGRGADVCIEASGKTKALHEAVRSCAYSSKVIALGFYQGEADNLYLGEEFHLNRMNVISSQMSGICPSLQHRWNHKRLQDTLINLLLEKKLRLESLVSHKISFFNASEAYELIAQHQRNVLQVILTFS